MSAVTNEDVEMDSISVTRIYAGEDEGGEITFEFNGEHITVSVFASYSSQNIEDHLIGLLVKATTDDLDDEYEDIVDEVLGVILDAGKAVFRQVAPLLAPIPSVQVLHSLLYPKTHHFRLETVDNKPAIVPILSNESYTADSLIDRDVDSGFRIDSELPQYSSREIKVLESFVGGGSVSRVLINDQEMLCKARRTGLLDQSLEWELVSLQAIKGFSRNSRLIRTPKLIGYVKHAEDGRIIGLLREWIPSGALGGRLKDVCGSTTSRERREKWATQIRETVDQLHEMMLVWGDGKPSNVIIDDGDCAWLIDLAGGWTDGWVDEEVADTVEGDEQAVRNIFKFLGVEAQVN